MDVYAPSDGKPHPAVVLVSGASNVRAWGIYKDYGRLIGGSGFVAVIPTSDMKDSKAWVQDGGSQRGSR